MSALLSVVPGCFSLYYFDGSTLFCYTFSKLFLRCEKGCWSLLTHCESDWYSNHSGIDES